MMKEDDYKLSFQLQKEEFERQKKEMLESIEYASLIQAALLPPTQQMKRFLGDHFILYLPRDIVSGDFYWIFHVDDWVYLAVVDCTGHGVPGALMSILGISFLNEILSKKVFIKPNRVLNLLREKVMKALHQTGIQNESKDGMDIGLIAYNSNTFDLHYAGANNFLHFIRDKSIQQVKGDRMPIGVSGIEENSFTNHPLRMKKNDIIYLFSDGFVDQFGGSKGKKYKYGPFEELLIKHHTMPMEMQKEVLLDAFLDWKGAYDQVDDILVLGLKI